MVHHRFLSGASLLALSALLAACGGSGSPLAPAGPMQPSAVRAGSNVPLRGAQPNATSSWLVYDYTPSGRALAPKPAQVSGGTASFTFVPNRFTALLATKAKSLTGDLTGKTLNDTITLSGATTAFVTLTGGGCGNPAAARFYFASPGFAYTNFWWSNPVSYTLANGTATLTAPLSDNTQWSDWNGQFGNTVPTAFAAAVAKVNVVGLSFGGDCFFENGATITNGTAILSSTFSEL